MLNKDTLKNSLNEFFDLFQDSEAVTEFTTARACAEKWASVITAYAATMTPPVVTTLAKDVLSNSLEISFAAEPGSEASSNTAVLSAGFSAFATALVPTMLPAFVGTPPPHELRVDLSSSNSAASAAEAFANAIHTWFTTGSAIQVSSGAVIPWS